MTNPTPPPLISDNWPGVFLLLALRLLTVALNGALSVSGLRHEVMQSEDDLHQGVGRNKESQGKKQKYSWPVTPILFSLLFSTLSLTANASVRFPDAQLIKQELRKPFKNLTFTDSNKKPWTLPSKAQHPANAHLLVFWASWCTPCIREMPQLTSVTQFFKKGGLNTIFLNLDKESPNIKKAQKIIQQQLRGEISAFLPKTFDPEKYSVESIPTFLFIDRKGRLAAAIHGSMDVHLKKFKKLLFLLLQE